jgi:hypothetical protein
MLCSIIYFWKISLSLESEIVIIVFFAFNFIFAMQVISFTPEDDLTAG